MAHSIVDDAARLLFRGTRRPAARVLTTLGNSAMVVYIYVTYLLGVEWGHFGSLGPAAEQPPLTVRQYLGAWELDPAFDHLRRFTFSEAMLYNLPIYLAVGVPVSMVLIALEQDRVTALHKLVAKGLPADKANRAQAWLGWYLMSFRVMLMFILLIAPCHLDMPRAHYLCAGFALSCGAVSMSFYLAASADFASIVVPVGRDDGEVHRWTSRVHHVVRPIIKGVLALHALALLAGALKAEMLGDDMLALLFGVLETSLILGYQLFAAVFVIDDVMLSRKSSAFATVDSSDEVSPGGESVAKLADPTNDSIRERFLGS